ncbi:hypothetical protein L6164_020653 [Bauhinia variegata]|uniref:Uncharacterized protein n=1 Tax=Bauhinia variegata TaxID=167791 RepID=A0ACB9MVT3_BAUVA|nr:hypothetical protein L6164_020653 [Bauhinia variegata]
MEGDGFQFNSYRASNSFSEILEGMMAREVRFNMLVMAACFIVLVAVAAAHEGHDHGAAPAEQPSSAPRSLTYPAALGGLLPFVLTFLLLKESV